MSRPARGHSIAVASRLSGVPIETLRAWERRHGFPRPERVEGTNRRLYSAGEIARLRSVAGAVAKGFRVGDVVHLTPAAIEALVGAPDATRATGPSSRSHAPADAPRARAIAAPARPQRSTRRLASVSELVAWLAADDVAAFDAALRTLAGALGPRDFVIEVAHPLAIAVGEAWASGTIAVRQEHYASDALATHLRVALGPLHDVRGAPTVVLATLPGELHGLGLAMVAVYVALAGGRPRILGVSTPVSEIAAAARALGADAVGLTITPATATKDLAADLRELERTLPRSTRLWLGGSGAPRARGARREVIADWSALDAAIARARVKRGATKESGGA